MHSGLKILNKRRERHEGAGSAKKGSLLSFLLFVLLFVMVMLNVSMFRPFMRSLMASSSDSSDGVDESSNKNSALRSASPSSADQTLCTRNPYAVALNEPLEVSAQQAREWLANVNETYQKADTDKSLLKHTHARFFPFEPMASCNATTCVGGRCRSDESKIVCGFEQLSSDTTTATTTTAAASNDKCVIYSIGGNNQWAFERDLLQRTKCDIHTFDCTGPLSRFQKPESDRLFFHHVCLGTENAPPDNLEEVVPGQKAIYKKHGATWTLAEMQKRLGHSQIDLLKMDVEGYEWPFFYSWSLQDSLPMQVLVEIHYQTVFPELVRPDLNLPNRKDFQSPRDMVALQEHLLRIGYVTVSRDNNRACAHCTELSLIRTHCSTIA